MRKNLKINEIRRDLEFTLNNLKKNNPKILDMLENLENLNVAYKINYIICYDLNYLEHVDKKEKDEIFIRWLNYKKEDEFNKILDL